MNKVLRRYGYAFGICLIPVAHHFVADIEGPLWVNTLKDVSHVPTYALLTVLLIRLVPPKPVWIVTVICASALVASGIEMIQAGRSQLLNGVDLYTTAIGIVTGTVWGLVSRHRGLLLTAALISVAPLVVDTWQVYRMTHTKLPELLPHPARFGPGLVHMDGSATYSDGRWDLVYGDLPWPRFERLEPPTDWRAYTDLVLDVELVDSDPIKLWVYAGLEGGDSINPRLNIVEGRQTVTIPLDSFQRDHVERLTIYTQQPFAGSRVIVHSARLSSRTPANH